MLVRNVRLRGKNKLADRWESTVYVVQKRAGNLPVYTVCPEGQDGPTRTLHQDLLLPCGFLSEIEEEPVNPKTPKRRTRQTTQMDDNHQSSDEDEDEIPFYPLEIETETRESSRPFSMSPSEDVAATGSQTEHLPELENLTEMELPNLPLAVFVSLMNLWKKTIIKWTWKVNKQKLKQTYLKQKQRN